MKPLKPMILTLLLLFCAPIVMAAETETFTGTGTGIVAETMDSAGYTYILLKQQGAWIATATLPVSEGDKVSFEGGMEMRNFHSRTLNRTFDSVFFIQGVNVVSQDTDSMHQAAGIEHSDIPMPASVAAPAPGEIPALADGKTIGDIVATPTALKDQQISLRARVIKVSESIMGKNWVTLQDGTGTEPDNKLLATSAEVVAPGDLVIASGTIRNDIDIGSGYTYKVLLENATFRKDSE